MPTASIKQSTKERAESGRERIISINPSFSRVTSPPSPEEKMQNPGYQCKILEKGCILFQLLLS